MASSPLFSEEERRAWTPFVIGVLHLLSVLDAELKASFDISHLDYGILMLLSQVPEHMQQMSVLAATFAVDPSNITYRVRRMEARHLVQRNACSADGRVVCVHLTEEGLALLSQAQVLHVQGARRYFLGHLNPEQLHTIASVFSNLRSVQQLARGNAYIENVLADQDEDHKGPHSHSQASNE